MVKLDDTQLIVLAAAVARDDGCAVIPETMKPAAVTKVGASLVARKLMREIKAKPGMPVWYEDGEGRGLSLVLTAAGRKAIGVNELPDAPAVPEPALAAAKPNEKVEGGRKAPATDGKPETTKAFREGSKSALLVKLLSAKNGVTLGALEDATGWLPHTTRAALTGLRKRGYAISRNRQPGENATYRIAISA